MSDERAFLAILYHDEPEEAATKSRTTEPRAVFAHVRDAVAALRAEIGDEWQTGEVCPGTLQRVPHYPRAPRVFVHSDVRSLRVGVDWAER